MELHQTKNFLQKTINKIKGQPTEWENIFTNDTFGTGLIPKIYTELIQFNTLKKNKQNNPIKNWAKDLNRH